MTFRVHVRVTPRPGLLDPQGEAVQRALHELGFATTSDVRIGRAIEFQVTAGTAAEAGDLARRMCDKLLANPVTEDYAIEVES